MADRSWIVGPQDRLPCGCTGLEAVPARQRPDGTWEPIHALEVDLARHVAWVYSVTPFGHLRRTKPTFKDGVRVFCQHGEVMLPRAHDLDCLYASGVPHDGPCVKPLRRGRL